MSTVLLWLRNDLRLHDQPALHAACQLGAQLLGYDVYSNQGNWLYIAGRGTDPRGGRRFDPVKQAATYDLDGAYQRLWGTA